MPPIFCLLLCLLPCGVFAQTDGSAPIPITVLVTPKPVNTFVAPDALGAGVDGLDEGDVAKVYTPANLRAMRSAGWGALTYRLRTELAVEAWHWNPAGTWSEAEKNQGYWTSQAPAPASIGECYGYRLPRRGSTVDQANNDGYSRLDDGDDRTFWKSNPYLDRHFTGEDNARHPQWILINLGEERPVDTIQIAWADPYAVRYEVQHWAGRSRDPDENSISETFRGGTWQTFPGGTVTDGRGGVVRLRLSPVPVGIRYLRVWMTASGAGPGAKWGDVRDGLGYAVREVGLGTTDARGRFQDIIHHAPDGKQQTQITVSSTDSWHRASDRDPDAEQPGPDRVFESGLTRGRPLLASAGLLYDTPENAAALLRFLRAHGYPISRMELGEEPDGQYVSPEDYGALYVQYADALHRVDPTLTLGGPSLQTTLYGWWTWPDARGDRSWMGRFVRYLRDRGRLADFGFFSFEWYPFDGVCAPPAPQVAQASGLLDNALARLVADGVPQHIPWLITEYGFSAFAAEAEMGWPGALVDAETAAQFLSRGGAAAYFYGYEPSAPIHESLECDTWGNLALLLSDDDRHVRQPLAAFYAARLLTRQWAQPDTDRRQALYRTRSAHPLVAAYALRRPDGLWSLLLLNKDPNHAHRVSVRFQQPGGQVAAFSRPADLSQYSSAQYVWHPNRANGYASPDKPPAHRLVREDAVTLPPYSLSVLRGRVPIIAPRTLTTCAPCAIIGVTTFLENPMTENMQRRITTALTDPPSAETRRLLRRLGLQIEFARAFAEAVPPQEAQGWAGQIAEADRLLAECDTGTGLDGLAATVGAAEAAMAQIGRAAKGYTLHCVGHGHIDMNWMWSWPETVATTHDTFASALRLMEQYPDFTFSQSQASVYALIERYHPAMFAQIQQRVKEGRWEITAAHWVEGDKNIASGESLCRHLLYTRRYFQDRFGLTPEDLPIDWEPDTFGHAATLPTILAQGAVRYYYSCRQGGGFDHLRLGPARPPLFWWQGPDGARVLVNRETTWYNSFENLTENIALPLTAFVKETGLRDWLNVYGVGNHGGGPTRAEIDYYRELQQWPVYPKIIFSTNKAYFEAVQRQLDAGAGERLPVVAHELNFEFTGCYTSQSLIKQANRWGENYLEEAETLALLAAKLGGPPVPKERLREAWLSVLFSQFHDILPGSGVRETREYAMAGFQEVGATTGGIKRTSLAALMGRINTLALLPDTWEGRQARAEAGRTEAAFEAGAGLGAGTTGLSSARGGGGRFRPYVVYNPCAWPRSERVTALLYDTGFDAARVVARDEGGAARPVLLLGQSDGIGGEYINAWGHKRMDVAFNAVDVPALGYRTYLLHEAHEGGASGPPPPTVTRLPQDWFETPALRFRLDRDRGGLLELWDKRSGAQLVGAGDSPLGAWAFVTERPRGMTAWVLGSEVDPPLSLRSTSFNVLGAGMTSSSGVVPTSSPAGFRAEWTLSVPGTQSTVRLSLAVHALEPRLDWTAELDWREIGDAERGIPGLTVRFPLALSGLSIRYEAPFGSVERNLFGGEEVPTLRYAHVSGEARTPEGQSAPAAVTLLQDCKHGHSVHGAELRMRVVRSSFDPDHAPEVAQSRVRYSLVIHDGPADAAETARLGAAWNHPLIVLPAGLQAGDAPARHGFAEVETPGVVLSALKAAEDGDGLILRLAEMNGQDTEAVVTLDPALADGATQAQTLDLMERPTGGSASWDGRTLRVPVKAHGLVTVEIS